MPNSLLEQSNHKVIARSIKRYHWKPIAAGLGGLFVTLCLLLLFALPEHEHAFKEQYTNNEAQRIAMLIDQRIDALEQQLTLIAQVPRVRDLMAGGISLRLSQNAEGLEETIKPEVEKLRLIPKGSATLDDTSKGPLTYSGLDMISRVEQKPSSMSEAFMHREDQWLVNVIAPVFGFGGDQEVSTGVVMAVVSPEALSKDLLSHTVPNGVVRVSKKVEDRGIIPLFSFNDVQDYKTLFKTIHTIDLNTDNWQIEYQGAIPKDLEYGDFLRNVIVLLCLTSLGFVTAIALNARVLNKDINANQEMLLNYMHALKDNRAKRPPNFTLSLFSTLAQPLRPSTFNKKLQAAADTQRKTQSQETPSNAQNAVKTQQEIKGISIPETIIRPYDILGKYGTTINEEIFKLIGHAFASESIEKKQPSVIVGYDGRLSSPSLVEALIEGLKGSGAHVINIGQVPTPVLYFACKFLRNGSGIMVTGGHNPPQYNGLIMLINNQPLSGTYVSRIRERIANGHFHVGQGTDELSGIEDDYIQRIISDIAIAKPMKVVLDCGNGITGKLAPRLFQALGCEVVPLFTEIDGHFPNHEPDPSKPKNLKALRHAVIEHEADLGIAFDGDGDRLVAVTNRGDIIWPDRLLMVFARDLLSRNPGADIIYDVKCSRRLNDLIKQHGGCPIMWKSGIAPIREKMEETNAQLAGEMSGHVFFKERWFGFDDAIYSATRLLEILSLEMRSAHEVFANLPADISTPELSVPVDDNHKFELIERLAKQGEFNSGSISTIDGLRVDFPDGWGIVRASKTSASIVMRFEAESESALHSIQDLFKSQLLALDESLKLPI